MNVKEGIISLGEALIDFIPTDSTNTSYQKSPGGAPANVAVGIARLGLKSTFVGKVGQDSLGQFLKQTLEEYQVDVSQMKQTNEAKTGFTLVSLAENGERSFEFYIDPSADRLLEESEIDSLIFSTHKIFHFGSLSFIHEPAATATKKAIELAKKNKMWVSYDPNLRLSLWKSVEQAKETILSMIPYADILKVSEEELEFITGEKTIEKGIEALAHYQIPIMFVTLGAEGSYVCKEQKIVKVPAMKVEAVDTTGAGDAFVSGILYSIHQNQGEITDITLDQLENITKFASVSGALAASTKGAMAALPTLDEVKQRLAKE